MSKQHCYSVYIMTNFSKKSLYTGVTNDLKYRVFEHKTMQGSSYTSKYKCFYLVYYEDYQYINEAIDREKQLKRWRRSKKVDLINIENKKWEDIADNGMTTKRLKMFGLKIWKTYGLPKTKNNNFRSLRSISLFNSTCLFYIGRDDKIVVFQVYILINPDYNCLVAH